MSNAALHVARTGLDAQQTRMRVIANNLANVNTTGFKRDRAEFETLAYQMMTAAGATASGDNRYAIGLNLGTGVQTVGTARVTTQGSLNTTDNPLDLAIEGDGYFQVTRSDGSVGYTRAGNFHLSSEGKVVTSDGLPLQPEIQIPEGATGITIGSDGTVSATVAGQTEATEVGRIELARFVNAAGLQALGGNLYAETAASGTAQVGQAGLEGRGSIRQGALEGSNVEPIIEMTRMMSTVRAYQGTQRLIETHHDLQRRAIERMLEATG